jgi:hypothetical protein
MQSSILPWATNIGRLSRCNYLTPFSQERHPRTADGPLAVSIAMCCHIYTASFVMKPETINMRCTS